MGREQMWRLGWVVSRCGGWGVRGAVGNLWEGLQGSGRVGYAVVIPGCDMSGRSGMEVSYSHILTFSATFASASGGVGSCGGWWIFGQSYTMCLAVSSPTPHFLQMASTAHPVLCSQYMRSG